MSYTHVLLDLDHTLLDSDTSLEAAYVSAVEAVGLGNSAHLYDTFDRINRSLWAAVERHEVTPPQVHTKRFELLLQELGADGDPQAMADAFAQTLGAVGELYDGAREVLELLAERATLAMVTNGLSDVQRARIERLDLSQYFEAIVISAEVGVAKPGQAIFDLTFEAIGRPAKEKAVMVGDNLPSDIKGGADYGVATCWYNPHGKKADPEYVITHDISALDQLVEMVSGRPSH